MARNGTGGFDLLVNSWNPSINGVAATAADWQALIDDIATAIAQSVSADGQTPITGNLDMGGNVLSGLGAGTSSGQSLRFEQLFSQGIQQNVAAGTTVDIGAQLSTSINITGTGTISSFGTNYNGPRFIRFDGVCTLTHSATLVIPGSVNITTAAGDTSIVVPLGNPATGWRLIALQRADGSVTATNVTASKVTLTGPINEARGSVAMHATTMDIWAQPNIIDGTGSPVTITAIANAPQAGARRTLYPIAGTVITNGATFAVDGAANYTTAAGDALEFEAVTTSTYKVHITKKDGTSVVTTTSTQVPTRQTVLSGPVDTSGFPTFLPSTSVNLNLTSQNVSTGANALVATAAGGANTNGAINVVGQATANLTWTGCTANQTNFLPVSVSGGALTALTPVILVPIYQWGGTPSVTANQYTYNIQQGIMYLGNGSAAVAVNHVIVGEAVAGASTITSTVAYVYQRKYASGYVNQPQTSGVAVSRNHNIGTTLIRTGYRIRCAVANNNYVVGEVETAPWMQGGTSNSSTIVPSISSRNSMRVVGGSTLGVGIFDRTTGGGINVSGSTSWDFELWSEGLF